MARRWATVEGTDEERPRHAITSEGVTELSRRSASGRSQVVAGPAESATPRTPIRPRTADDVGSTGSGSTAGPRRGRRAKVSEPDG